MEKTRSEMQRDARLLRRLDREIEDLERNGLEERAAQIRKDRDKVAANLKAAKRAAEEARLEELRMKREAAERQAAMEAERKAEAERRAEAEAWWRTSGRFSGGRPRPARETLRAAKLAGVDLEALEAVTVRVRRRKDAVECLATPGTYLRRDFIEVESSPRDVA